MTLLVASVGCYSPEFLEHNKKLIAACEEKGGFVKTQYSPIKGGYIDIFESCQLPCVRTDAENN